MDSTAKILAVAGSTLQPGQSTQLPTFSGTTMTLALINTDPKNNCSWSVTGYLVSPSSGVLSPAQTQVFQPTNYGGATLTVSNSTSSSVPAVLQVVLS